MCMWVCLEQHINLTGLNSIISYYWWCAEQQDASCWWQNSIWLDNIFPRRTAQIHKGAKHVSYLKGIPVFECSNVVKYTKWHVAHFYFFFLSTFPTSGLELTFSFSFSLHTHTMYTRTRSRGISIIFWETNWELYAETPTKTQKLQISFLRWNS